MKKHMKKIIIFWAMVFLFSIKLFAANKYGIGIILGEPQGLSFEVNLSDNKNDGNSLSLATNFNTADGYFYLHCDYLIKYYNYVPKKDLTGKIPLFYGAGIKYATYDINASSKVFGIRVVFGVEYIFEEIPFDIFAILSPVLEITPRYSLYLAPSFGVRYFFK